MQEKRERVAWLSVVGSVVCVGGAWLMRRAQAAREEREGSNLPSTREEFRSAPLRSPHFEEWN
jgi:hypothetical protein